MQAASYFCPFSNRFQAWQNFKELTGWEQCKTLTVTVLAVLATLPVLGIGGVAAFRGMVGHYYKKIDPISPGDGKDEQTAVKVNEVAPDVINPVQEGDRPVVQDVQDDVQSVEVNAFDAILSKSLDEFSDEEARTYVVQIKAGIARKDEALLEKANSRFMEQIKESKSRALELHQSYQDFFKELPEVNPETGIAASTLTQFKLASRMVKQAFPGLTTLAFGENQKAAVSRLVQFVMCGESAMDAEMPEHSRCFTFIELKGKSTPASDSSHDSYLMKCLEILQQRQSGESDNDWHKRSYLEAVHLFVSDCLNRTLNSFHCGDKVLKMGRNQSDPAVVIKEIRDQMLADFRKNPQSIQALIDQAKTSDFVGTLKTLFPTEDQGLLPESVLSAALAEQQKVFSADAKVAPALLAVIEYCQIDPHTLGELSRASDCSVDEIEPLVRIKVMEMILLMNQGFQVDGLGALLPYLMNYGEDHLLHPSTYGSEFKVSSKGSCPDLTTRLLNQICVNETDYSSQGIVEYFEKYRLALAEVATDDRVLTFSAKQSERQIIGMHSLKVSWQITDAIVDHLVGQINPEAVKVQPEEKYVLLKESLVQGKELLKEIAQLPLQKGIVSGIWGMLGWNSSKSEGKDIQQIDQIVGKIIEGCHGFMQVIPFVENSKGEAFTLLQEVKSELVNAYKGLKKIQEHYRQKNRNEDVEALDQVFDAIDAILPLLPSDSQKEVSAGYWDRLQGTFGQSQKQGDLQWKVHKYETQILILKQRFNDVFEDILTLDHSFVDLGTPQQEAIRTLHAILNEVEINPQDKERYSQEYLAQVRHVYNERFLPVFRQAFLDDRDNPLLWKVAEILFTEVDLEQQCFETLRLFNEMGALVLEQNPEADTTVHGEHSFVQMVNTVYKRLGAVPYGAKAPLLNQWANSARGQWNINFDPYRQGNPTHDFWHLLVGDRLVKMLGMGTPTTEDSRGNATLNPEFIALMKRYKEQGMRHLYVNNQNTIPKTGWMASIINGDETARCNLIEEAQEQEEMKGALFAISLSKNSGFYSQKGDWASVNDAKTFKGSLYNQIFVGPKQFTGCYIPQGLKDLIPDFDKKSKDMMDEIHAKVFGGRENLTQDERKWFIELYYDHLIKMLIVEGKMDSVNDSCKDQIDRGAGANAQLCANTYIVAQDDGKLTPEQQEHVLMLMMVRALLVRKRPPLPERVKRFTEGLEMSLKHVNELKALHQALFPDVAMMPQRVGV
jgi:hypothetical protein